MRYGRLSCSLSPNYTQSQQARAKQTKGTGFWYRYHVKSEVTNHYFVGIGSGGNNLDGHSRNRRILLREYGQRSSRIKDGLAKHPAPQQTPFPGIP